MKTTIEMNTLELKAALSKGTLLALVESVEAVEIGVADAPAVKPAREEKKTEKIKKEDTKPAATPEVPKEEIKPEPEEKTTKSNPPVEEKVDDTKPAASTAKEYTLEEVRAKMTELTQAGKQVQVKALISKYGGNRLSDIKPENYAALMAESEGL